MAEITEPKKGITSRARGRTAREVDLIRQDRAITLARGMFVLDARPDAPRQNHDVQLGNASLMFSFTPMSGYELRVLHGISALCTGTIRGELVTYEASDQRNDAVRAWLQLGPTARVFGDHMSVLRTTKRQLAEVVSPAGKVGGKEVERTMEALRRLAEVTIHIKGGDRSGSTPLLSWESKGNRLVLHINPRIVAATLIGERGGFSLLSMHDLRAVRNESTHLLYSRLCSYIDAGTDRVLKQDTIEEYIWGNVLPDEARPERKVRRRVILKALAELERLDPPWIIEELVGARGAVTGTRRHERSSFRIVRPKRVASLQAEMPLSIADAEPGLPLLD